MLQRKQKVNLTDDTKCSESTHYCIFDFFNLLICNHMFCTCNLKTVPRIRFVNHSVWAFLKELLWVLFNNTVQIIQ